MRSTRAPFALVFVTLTACGEATISTTAGETSSTGENPGTGDPTSTTADPTTGEDPALTTTTTDRTTGATTGHPTTDTTDTTGDPGADDSSDGTASTADTTDTGAAQELPPIESVEILEAWLAAGSYKTWAAETGVHPSTGPHGGNVRTFVNDLALASLAAQNIEHPQDSATVKELYADGVDEIVGYAVSRKTTPASQGGDTWYWYERIDATTYGGELGVGLCTGCHGGGSDFILTPFPLQ